MLQTRRKSSWWQHVLIFEVRSFSTQCTVVPKGACNTHGPNGSEERETKLKLYRLLDALKRACSSRNVEAGKRMHAAATECGLHRNPYVANSLLNMYTKCGDMSGARQVFEEMSVRDVIPWNTLILGYATNGNPEVALELFKRMQAEGCEPNGRTYLAASMACANLAVKEAGEEVEGKLVKLGSLEKGMLIHSQALKGGYGSDKFLRSMLISMYAKCGSILDSRLVFDKMAAPDLVAWNSLIRGYAENGEKELAAELSASFEAKGLPSDSRTFANLDVQERGRKLEAASQRTEGRQANPEMYALLRALKTACSSGDLETGKRIHAVVIESGLLRERWLANSLMNMYTKCGTMSDARQVFEEMRIRDVISWNTLISGYAANGEAECALQLFERMQTEGCEPNGRTYLAAATACTSLAENEEGAQVGGKLVKLGCLDKGMVIHSEALKRGCGSDKFLASMLISMYGKCGSMVDSRLVFDKMALPDLVAWNALILGYAENGENDLALEVFSRLEAEGLAPNSRTFLAASVACGKLAVQEEARKVEGMMLKVDAFKKGMTIHSQAAKCDCTSDMFLQGSLIDMYMKCGSLADARAVFDSMLRHDVVSWTSLILGYAENGEPELALKMFGRMQDEGCPPDSRTFVAALVACANFEATGRWERRVLLAKGRDIHSLAEKFGCSKQTMVANSLIGMYGKRGSLEEARKVFDEMPRRDVVSCTVLMVASVENGNCQAALKLFDRMQTEGLTPTGATYVAAAMACARLAVGEKAKRVDGKMVKVKCLERGMDLHSQASRAGFATRISVASSMVEMFAQCRSMQQAKMVFEKMDYLDTTAWNVLILGYAENAEAKVALECYARMRAGKWRSNTRTYVAVLRACGSLACGEIGKEVHAEICRRGMERDPFVATSLIDFYGKCGSTQEAQRVFDRMKEKDPVAWTTVLGAYSRQGNSTKVLDLFQEMVESEIEADGVAFLAVLAACGRCGDVEKGRKCFEAMVSRYGIKPGIEHYHCMIDMLGRANCIDEAVGLAKAMPYEGNVITWTTILSACQKWKNVEMGRVAFEEFQKVDATHPASYSLMANIYGGAGMWDEQRKILESRRGPPRSQESSDGGEPYEEETSVFSA